MATWSDSTITKLKQVLTKILVETGYIDNARSKVLNTVYLYPEVEDLIRRNGDENALTAFNRFD